MLIDISPFLIPFINDARSLPFCLSYLLRFLSHKSSVTSALGEGESSALIRQRVETARAIQAARFADIHKANILVNGDMWPAEVQRFCLLDEAGKNLMRAAMQQMNLSARAYHRMLKLARTIADLANIPDIQTVHLAEAIQNRPRE